MNRRLGLTLVGGILLALLANSGLQFPASPALAQPPLASISAAPPQQAAPPPDRATIASRLNRAPLMFVANSGQFAPGLRFQVRRADETLWLAEDGLWITALGPDSSPVTPNETDDTAETAPVAIWEKGLGGKEPSRRVVNVKLSFVGSNPHPRLAPFSRLDTHVSYLFGNDPAKWRADVPAWGGVRYVDLYPGIDLELSGAGGQLQPRLVVRADANLEAVRLLVEGADALALDGNDLHLTTAAGMISWPLLQVVAAHNSPVPEVTERPGVRANEIVAPFTTNQPAASPPQDIQLSLSYSTFLGGGADDSGYDVAVDASGAAYVTGFTESVDFPTTPGALQPTIARPSRQRRICGGVRREAEPRKGKALSVRCQ